MILLARVGRLFGSAGEQATSQILGNSVSLVGSVAMTSGVGFVYWFVAALLFPQAQIGIAAASISAMSLLAALGTFGLGTLLIAEIPRHAGREVGLIATAMIFSGCAGVALGVVFALGVATVNPEFRPLAASPWIVSLFSLGIGLTAAAAVSTWRYSPCSAVTCSCPGRRLCAGQARADRRGRHRSRRLAQHV
jgi:O-antigen/teichoic acid export membrane protein